MATKAPVLELSQLWPGRPTLSRTLLSPPTVGLNSSSHIKLTTTAATIAGQMSTLQAIHMSHTARSTSSAPASPRKTVNGWSLMEHPDPGIGNERTALAWQRTALAVLAAAAILSRLTFDRLGLLALVSVGASAPIAL